MINKNTTLNIKKHLLDKHIRSTLSDNLRKEYNKRNARVIKGDSVKVLRGEYKNVEGKVEKLEDQLFLLRGSKEKAQREVKLRFKYILLTL